MVLDNFQDTGIFTEEDLNLAAGLTRQAALTLENARLFQAAEQRADQLSMLTNVAATITSSLQSDELINSLLDQVKNILPFDTGTLWLRQGNILTVRAAAGFEDSERRLGLAVAVEDSELLKEMIETGQPASVGDVRKDVRFPSLVEPRYLSWLGIPLISKGEVVGVIALEKEEANYYSTEAIRAAITFAGQAAVALENARLYEESVRRAAELDEGTKRLTLLNRLSTALSGSLDTNYILGVVMREMADAVHCELVSAILFDRSFQPVLEMEEPKAASDYPQTMPACPIFDRLRETMGVFTTDDVFQEELLAPLREFLSQRSTRALLIVPLGTGNELSGLFFAHSQQPLRFEADEVEVARTISNQAAVAIQNARLFQETERLFEETQQRTAELGMLFDLGMNITQVLDRNRLIEATFENVIHMTGADSAGLVLEIQENVLEARALDKGEWVGPVNLPKSGTSFSEYVLRIGAPLIIRDMDREKDILPVQGVVLGEPVKSWLGVPLMVRGESIGVLSVQSYHANAFGEAQVRLMGQVANQLSVALDNARLFETTQSYAQDMAQMVSERTKELETEHKRSQTLLRVITELSASLDLDMVLSRTLAILNEAISAEHSLIMMVNPEEDLMYLRSSIGYATSPVRGGEATAYKTNEGLAGWVVTNKQAVLISDLWDDERWIKQEDEHNQHRSAIAAPLMIGEDCLGALILYHRRPNAFNQDMLDLTQAASKQIAVSINNSQLFNLIRDQAERLGDMLRTQHIETSRSQAILEAVADGVLVTDSKRMITLFNASAEKILGLERQQVVGRSLENFIGLFGRAAHEWVQTIRMWSENPTLVKAGESKSEQIVLDDKRVVSVHLSPVLLRNDFLGTVSIFQDITHLIELDRLKSEFVATVSHELRTPMTSIKGYVEILLMGAAGSLTEQQTHFLQVVRSNTERLAVLVNDLLDISRIEAGRVTLSMQPIDAVEIAQNSYDMIMRRSQDEGKSM
jgi:PAS domain S-box-containing protein